MAFLRFPETGVSFIYSNATLRVFLSLIQNHFHLAQGKYEKEFYITDRDLSRVTGCSLRTIWKSKKFLRDHKFINFRVGFKNRTYYTILSPNGRKPK